MKYDELAKHFSYSDVDHDLWVFFTRVRYSIYRAREKELLRYRVSPEQMGVLFIIQSLDNRGTPSEIARHFQREPHTVSALLDRMEKKGFIKKTNDLDKRNLVRVSLTPKGTELFENSKKRGPVHRIMGILTDEEKAQLRSVLAKLQGQAHKELGLDREKYPSSD